MFFPWFNRLVSFRIKTKQNKPIQSKIIGDDLFREDIDMVDGENDNDEDGEVPMLHLASFALHKLFSEWQSEGFEIPDFKIGAGTAATPMETATAIDKALNAPGIPPKRTTLPENANTMHPTTLLCMVSGWLWAKPTTFSHNHHKETHDNRCFVFHSIFTNLDAPIDEIRGFGQ